MNKPVAFICCCIAAIGVLILGYSSYLTIVYGKGNMAAGQFHRCHYLSKRDAATGRVFREWTEVFESTERPVLQNLDIWAVGIAFIVGGAAIFIGEHCSRTPRDA